jgi:hypothetical protein
VRLPIDCESVRPARLTAKIARPSFEQAPDVAPIPVKKSA